MNEEPTPEQALKTLSAATQPGINLSRKDYIMIELSLNVLAELIQEKQGESKAEKNIDG